MSPLGTVRAGIGASATAVAVVGLGWGGYLTAVGVAATRSLRRPAPTTPPQPDRHPRRMRILVPAHDEEVNLGDTLASLLELDYPSELFEIHVVADNCTDATAAIARSYGVGVHERVDTARPGKGPALTWLLERLPVGDPDDGVVIVDADTLVSPDLLWAFDDALDAPVAAVQGHYGVRDPQAGGEVAFRAAALAVRHLVRPAGRTELGGSSSLYGNGMAFRESIARRYRWSDELTEDLEMGLRLLLDGHRVGFRPDAHVEAIMPDNRDAATSQNERWEAGRLRVARTYVPRLLAAARRRAHGRRWPYLDAALDISLPPLTTTVALTAGSGAVAAVAARGAVRFAGVSAAGCGLALQLGHVVHSLGLADEPAEVRRSLLRSPSHALWKTTLLGRVARRRPGRWIRTARATEVAA